MLGTFVELGVIGPGPAAIEAAYAAIAQVQRSMSYHDPESELSRLNRLAARRPVRVSADLARVVRTALALATESDGAFDPTIAPTLAGWGLLPRLAGRSGKERCATWRDVELARGGHVRFHRPLHLDLGGIAKGFAVDRAVDALREAGALAGIVNAGGDLRVFGGDPWPVLIRDPRRPGDHAAELAVRDAAIATSAHYFSRKRWRGRWVSALVDGRDRRERGGDRRSVTVHAPTAMIADALTKVVFALGCEAEGILHRHAAMALVLDQGTAVRLGE